MGFHVRELREAVGMTQEELAVKSGVSRVTISNLETKKEYSTTSKTLRKIAEALGVTIDRLFFGPSV